MGAVASAAEAPTSPESPKPQVPAAAGSGLAALTNAELRAQVADFVAGMKAFENAYRLERLQITNNDSIQDPESELDRIDAGHARRFLRDYRPRAFSLRGELLRRLNRPPAVESGKDASPADLAADLTELAAQLP